MSRPAWIVEAERHIGQREVKGPPSNPWIAKLWASLPGGNWFWTTYGADDSKLPWCGAFMAAVFSACRIAFPNTYAAAASWSEWGQPLAWPALGCVVTFTRQGGGHVGIVVGQDAHGNLLVLGGNQGDEVNVRLFARGRATAYRWPPGLPLPARAELLIGSAAASTSEA